MSVEPIDIGSGVSIEPFSCTHRALAGYFLTYPMEAHPRGVMVGGVSICPDCTGPTWDVVKEEPLTLSPSIETILNWGSATVHVHGFIQDGKWVPA